MEQGRIRNFCIIAHVDHGKSTLADRLLDATQALTVREKRAQFLDKMDLERERGITIKAQTARIYHRARDGEVYVLNLIDTPGHVDFSYEVSRALQACEGAVLVVDAAQGIEAQTLANTYLAVEAGLEILPVLNKIDLPSAEPERVAREIEDVIGLDREDVLSVSAKTGQGIDELLERIVEKVPPPAGDPAAPLRALVYDSWFDSYVGVVVLVRVVDGRLGRGDRVRLMAKGSEHEVSELDLIDPHPRAVDALETGEVGIVIAGIKTLADVRIGDTMTRVARPAASALPGFREVKPMVFAGLYPIDGEDYADLKAALEKLRLNDASFGYEPESSAALGFGFRCGFLGFLHAEIIQERLEREYQLSLITTSPTVRYRVILENGQALEIDSPAALPDVSRVDRIEEPVMLATIHVPSEYVGSVLELCQDRRGIQRDMHVHGSRVQIRYELPLAEIVADFHDRLKSATRGYGSFDYELVGFRPADLVKLDVLVNGQAVDALSLIVHRDKAYQRGSDLVRKLKEFIPRQMYEVALQAAVGSRVIARSTVKALRKNVTAKCYGGDISRKRKLLEKQKEGKRRMKRVGQVEIPQEAFLAALRLERE
ncbi:translation elongation factor 4 [Myxococcota bacterium]|nr:translation elongation factor 4 [Myxococcota bacterium]MCZ7619494.1 translation elongation factor 4 [Myxococcota bacterium]